MFPVSDQIFGRSPRAVPAYPKAKKYYSPAFWITAFLDDSRVNVAERVFTLAFASCDREAMGPVHGGPIHWCLILSC